jgi:serine protease Do
MVWVSNEGVAGARVETINEGLGKAIGVKQGVLVIRAQPGTPAYRSGLRDGDVVLSADGRQLVRVNDLRAIVARGDGEEGVKLVIVRERKRRDVTLRW